MNEYVEGSPSTLQIKGDPSPRRGKRNLWCPNYRSCLDYAVDHNWRAWNCFRCPHKHLEETPDLRNFLWYRSTFFYEMSTGIERGFDDDF